MNYFTLAVAALNGAAGVQYALTGKFTLAVVWVCYGIAAAALGIAGNT